jgi:hypothetical protein
VLVYARGRELDSLRGEAYQIARHANVDWWVEARERGTAFCFGDASATSSFRALCEEKNIRSAEA